ncbi:MarR family winged helix-turn-helix transcriptional regulator [Arthrobacter sp. A5]|uniref:MarR family winged helix-turn-helix transcriptional regulator n=1 Tax=Arthrobacter sp. A5 TaxID=576926 RepID=UPI003DA875A9
MRVADLHRLARALREIALLATENIGSDAVNAGELAVIEDIARYPDSTVSDVTKRTGLAQSLVSRIVRVMNDAGVISIRADLIDRRKNRLNIEPAARPLILTRANNTITDALIARTPRLSPEERAALEHHLSKAAALVNKGSSPGPSE